MYINNRPRYSTYTRPKSKWNWHVNCNPIGCLLTIVCIILIAFVLTHIGPLWADLSGVFGG